MLEFVAAAAAVIMLGSVSGRINAAAVVVAPEPDVDDVPFKIDIDAFGGKITGLLTAAALVAAAAAEVEVPLSVNDEDREKQPAGDNCSLEFTLLEAAPLVVVVVG